MYHGDEKNRPGPLIKEGKLSRRMWVSSFSLGGEMRTYLRSVTMRIHMARASLHIKKECIGRWGGQKYPRKDYRSVFWLM